MSSASLPAVQPRALLVEELRRLRRDFEAQASQYHALTLSVFYVPKGERIADLVLPRPHHAINLWQYVGDGKDVREQVGLPDMVTRFGWADAEMTALGVVAGAQTELFQRMAARAASLISDEARQLLNLGIIERIRSTLTDLGPDGAPEKPVFAANSNPFAVWLNWMLTIAATVQPERFRGERLEVDPFSGSLAAVDYLLEVVERDARHSAPAGGSRSPEEILEIKPGFAGVSINVRALLRRIRECGDRVDRGPADRRPLLGCCTVPGLGRSGCVFLYCCDSKRDLYPCVSLPR